MTTTKVFWARDTEHPQKTDSPANHCFNENRWSATWFWSLLSKVFRIVQGEKGRIIAKYLRTALSYVLCDVFVDVAVDLA